jgi:hypothetical protein
MSSDAEGRSPRQRWRAPVIGAVAGLSVAAAIVGPSALADSGGGGGAAGKTPAGAARVTVHAVKERGAPAPGGVPHQFTDAVAQLVQAGTITAAQGRALDAQIATGSMNPDQMVARGVLSAAQMAKVNERLVAVKRSLVAQARPQIPPAGAAAAKAACGTGAGSPPAA